jgi:carbon monoxide dehydrogenase subunit G
MELEHSFTVPVPKDRAWDVLLDVARVASCMPGATLDSVDGDEVRGKIKVKVGPISMTYAGTARFVEQDKAAGVVTMEASGKETKGAGTASATVRAALEDRGNETHVTVQTTLNVTGKPAQFGRGVMSEVSEKLLGIFASNLAATLDEDSAVAAAQAAGGPGSNGEGGTGAGGESAPTAQAAGPGQADLGASVDELGLPTRAASSLHREGIATIGELVARSDDQLLAIDGIGPASVVDIKARLADRGLELGHPEAAEPAPAAAATPVTAPAASTSAGYAAGAAAATTAPGRAAANSQHEDSLNLLKVAGMPMLKRALPVLAGVTAVLLIGLRRRIRRRRH